MDRARRMQSKTPRVTTHQRLGQMQALRQRLVFTEAAPAATAEAEAEAEAIAIRETLCPVALARQAAPDHTADRARTALF